MPLLDSFTVDHTRMKAPAVRIAKIMQSPNKDTITVFDLRFCLPNVEMLSERGIHTLEHLFAGFMRDHLNSHDVEIIDISPMGCRTGFYMSLIGKPSESRVCMAWLASMDDILKINDSKNIPELNKYQCGSFTMHSLEDAHNIANQVVSRGVTVNYNHELHLPVDIMS